jgi:hypothetical protein
MIDRKDLVNSGPGRLPLLPCGQKVKAKYYERIAKILQPELTGVAGRRVDVALP